MPCRPPAQRQYRRNRNQNQWGLNSNRAHQCYCPPSFYYFNGFYYDPIVSKEDEEAQTDSKNEITVKYKKNPYCTFCYNNFDGSVYCDVRKCPSKSNVNGRRLDQSIKFSNKNQNKSITPNSQPNPNDVTIDSSMMKQTPVPASPPYGSRQSILKTPSPAKDQKLQQDEIEENEYDDYYDGYDNEDEDYDYYWPYY